LDSNAKIEKNREETNIRELIEYIEALNEHHRSNFLNMLSTNILAEQELKFSDEYIKRIEEIDDELVMNAQNDQLNEFAQYNTGSLEIVIDLSCIIAFLEWDFEVEVTHLEKAYNFLKRTRKSVEDTFKQVHPYRVMYDLLKLKDNMTISEMAEFEADIPIAKSKVADNVALLEELCYRNDEVLVQTQGKVTRFKIEPLPITNLNKLIVGISIDGKREMSTIFEPHEISWDQLKRLVVSEKVNCFTTAHFEDNRRKKDNFIQGQNLIALDIDEGKTIEEFQEIFKGYRYLIYTTKSHQKPKGDAPPADRFRVIIPTKTKYYVTEDQHKRMYANFIETYEITGDTQTFNVSRLWFTNPGATIIESDGELFDITPFIPDTEKSERIMPVIHDVNQQLEEGEIDRREAGFIKWFITNTSVGNRHENLTRAAYFFRDLGLDWKNRVARLNAMLDQPMTDAEMRFIYSIK